MIWYRVKRVKFTNSEMDGWEYAKKTKYSLVWTSDVRKASFWKRRSDLSNAISQGRLAYEMCNSVIEEVEMTATVKTQYKPGWILCE